MTPEQIELSEDLPGFDGTQLQEQTYAVSFWLKEIALQLALLNERDDRVRTAVAKACALSGRGVPR